MAILGTPLSASVMTGQAQSSLDPVDIRWKMAVACDVCRRRKVRCDGERPCSRCEKGHRECTFSLPRHVARRAQDTNATKRTRVDFPSQDNLPPSKRSSHSSQSPSDDRPESGSGGISPPTHIHPGESDSQYPPGPSGGTPLFARLGLLRAEGSEGDKEHGHAARSAATPSRDYLDMCLQRCPQELMNNLVGHFLSTPIFFPLLHTPSFLWEFIAVTDRRQTCTAQYAALLMSILALTARLVEGGRALVPLADRAGEAYFEFAQDLLRVSKNKLDINRILALYHLALFAESSSSAGIASSFLAEAVGLAFAIGLHRTTDDPRIDPVTLQIRTRLFWALYSLDVALAYSQGRPGLIRLNECNVELPAVVDNGIITKTDILPQPADNPPVIMAAAVRSIDISIILEQVLSAINAPFVTISQRYDLGFMPRRRNEKLARAEIYLDEIEHNLPPYLSRAALPEEPADNLIFLQSSRVRVALLFVRILISRQALVDESEAASDPAHPSDTTLAACLLALEIIKIYSKLRRLGFLQYCSFTAVSHLTAASHTLIACMLKSSDLVYEHRPDLLSAIDMLVILSARFPCAEAVAQLLVQLSRSLDSSPSNGASSSEALAIRVLARNMAPSPATGGPPSPHPSSFRPPSPARERKPTPERYDHDWLVKTASDAPMPTGADDARFRDPERTLPLPEIRKSTIRGMTPVGQSWNKREHSAEPAHVEWGNRFSFLNDGLFGAV